jgi:hypothetical protein
MKLPFNEALADLLSQYTDMDLEDIISDMEMMLDGLRDDLKSKEACDG